MGGDYTRWTFDPAKDYAEVFKQQGRVDLDADWNELVEIVNRRWRAETIDIIGRAVVPESTPHAFQITPTGPGQFSIGVGRMYVDGLLAECHGIAQGVPPTTFDASLGEIVGNAPVPFNSQPYCPNPSPLPSGAGVTDLIYLDVWSREITAIQAPHIREKALGGPDTATRMQTVWQVKILPNVGQVGCGSDIPQWDALTAPSAGRLTTSTIVPTPSSDPCILSPTGGYRGLENRLYRVEVHVAGTVGGAAHAQFKWSRDNASLVSPVTAISAPGGPTSTLTLKTLGRDQVLRFQANDWVEILDDYSEFAGTAGFLTQITAPPIQANRMITVNPPIPAGMFDPTKPHRHTRVRRWDQTITPGGDVNANGLIPVTAAATDIEDGIQVTFNDNPVGGQLNVGDYWLFDARTADGSVGPPHQAPPRGILHHYARLGFITWTAASGTPVDCRTLWPPSCGGDCTGCCTVTVGDGVESQGSFTDIQAAINSLGTAGGIVCLGRGVFMVPNGIEIGATQNNVTIRGMGWATQLIFAPDPLAGSRVLFDIEDTSQVTLESFFAVAANAQSMVRIGDSQFCVVRDTTLVNLNISPAQGTAFAGAEVLSGRAIELDGVCVDCKIENNLLMAAKGIVATAGQAAAATGTIDATVMDVTGAAIADATVTLTDPDGTTQSASTNATGRFVFASLAPGNYTVSATSGAASAQQAVTVVSNTTANVNLVLPAGVGVASGAAAHAAGAAPIPAAATADPSNVQGISIRNNRILALQVSVFLLSARDCDIVGNQMLGLSRTAQSQLAAAAANGLTRATISAFQQAVLSVLSALTGEEFQAAAIILVYGERVTIKENVMAGLLGIFSIILVETLIEDNQMLALVALLFLVGFAIRLAGNFIAGLLAGVIQVGLLLDFECESNFWLGLFGILFLPFPLFDKHFSPLFNAALESGGFAASGETVTQNVNGAIETSGGDSLRGFGLVGIVKIHDEVFLTAFTGIATFPGVLTGDVTIFDNSFELCDAEAIYWDTTLSSKPVAALLPPNHLIEGNTLNVTGRGIVCRSVEAVIRGNTIQCPNVGILAGCQTGVVQGNTITSAAASSNLAGLIELESYQSFNSENSSFRVAGNRLENGQGHGILIGQLDDLRIEDNVIQGMAQNGITTASEATLLQAVCISGNDISNCQGGGGTGQPGAQGAIILPEVENDLWVHGNRLTGNQGVGMFLNGNYTVVTEGPQLLLRIQDNSMDGDGVNPMIVAGGGAVQFTSNQCIQGVQPQTAVSLVSLTGLMIVANANTVLGTQQQAGVIIASLVLVPVTGGVSNAIATSNILNGQPEAVIAGGASFATFVNANNIAT